MTRLVELELRRATLADAARLYAWRMHESSVVVSFSTEGFGFADHVAWLTATLSHHRSHLYILTALDERNMIVHVGMGRVDLHDENAELSVAVDPRYRGIGLARWIIMEMIARTPDADVSRGFIARIKTSNVASLCAFWACGFRLGSEYDGVVSLVRSTGG